MKKNVVFLIPYFGRLPSYFAAFLLSVAGKNFDIYFFTDTSKPAELPQNCKWHYFSFDEIRQLFKLKLQCDVVLTYPRKLCDFKPALGLAFEEYIKEYTFWGSIDLDVCVGDFEKFLNIRVLERIDIFSGIKEYVSGSVFLVRNNDYFNKLFKKSKHWQVVFSVEKYMGFDECGGQYFNQLKAGKTLREINPPVESFTEVLFNESPEQTRLCFNNIIAEPKKNTTYVNENKVICGKKEYLLVHYIFYKAWYSFYTDKRVKFPFYINRLGFFQYPPSYLNTLFSENFWVALRKKIEINLRKLKLNA